MRRNDTYEFYGSPSANRFFGREDINMKRMPWLFSIVVIIIGLLAGSCGDGRDAHETLTLLFWQAPSIANPYLSSGNKDTEAAALVLEPLANYGGDGELVPRLAASIPTLGKWRRFRRHDHDHLGTESGSPMV